MTAVDIISRRLSLPWVIHKRAKNLLKLRVFRSTNEFFSLIRFSCKSRLIFKFRGLLFSFAFYPQVHTTGTRLFVIWYEPLVTTLLHISMVDHCYSFQLRTTFWSSWLDCGSLWSQCAVRDRLLRWWTSEWARTVRIVGCEACVGFLRSFLGPGQSSLAAVHITWTATSAKRGRSALSENRIGVDWQKLTLTPSRCITCSKL